MCLCNDEFQNIINLINTHHKFKKLNKLFLTRVHVLLILNTMKLKYTSHLKVKYDVLRHVLMY